MSHGNFVRKPTTVWAWLIEPSLPQPDWVRERFESEALEWCPAGKGLYVADGKGHTLCPMGHYLLRGSRGETYTLSRERFHQEFEPLT